MLTINHHTNILDATVAAYNSVEALFAVAQLNGIGITDEPAPGTQLQAPRLNIQPQELQFTALPPQPKKQPLKKHQTLADYVTQHCGTLEAIFEVAQLNGIGITDAPSPGTQLQAHAWNMPVVRFFAGNQLDIVSLLPATAVRPGGIGYMQIQNDFIVS